MSTTAKMGPHPDPMSYANNPTGLAQYALDSWQYWERVGLKHLDVHCIAYVLGRMAEYIHILRMLTGKDVMEEEAATAQIVWSMSHGKKGVS